MNAPPQNPNMAQLVSAAEKLVPLLDRIAFVGGCATGLLLTDPAAAPVRPTLDVDAIVAISSYLEFTLLEDHLRGLGFHQPHSEGAPICRWMSGDLVLDLMPTDPSILGFSNRWYRPALENAQRASIGEREILLITAPYFLATKLEAFYGRGRNNFGSHDLEDVVTVIDGRPRSWTRSISPHQTCRNISAISLEIYYQIATFWKHCLATCFPTLPASSVSAWC